MTYASMVVGTVADSVSIFDPFAQLPPLHGFWADDPAWSRPADGALVPSWRNGGTAGGGNAANGNAGQQPTMRYSTPAFNGRGTVEATTAARLLTVAVTTIAQPFKTLVVASISSTNGIALGLNNSNTGMGKLSATWFIDAGTQRTGGVADTNPHVHRTTWNGASSIHRVDGTTVISGLSPNVGGITACNLFAGPGITTPMAGHIAFWGVYANSTSDTDLANLETALRSHYGI